MNRTVKEKKKQLAAEMQKAIMELLLSKGGEIPVTEEGMEEVQRVCLEAYRRLYPGYTITVEPQTEEDRNARRAPAIRITWPKQISISVMVDK